MANSGRMAADVIAPTGLELTDEERRQLVGDAIDRGERIVESEIEMAKLFAGSGRIDVARRRLREVIERFPESEAAEEARRMLRSL